jgi:NAD(P)-dependent dehydrogenase (short-subunit alcohol dehydrogenase family)
VVVTGGSMGIGRACALAALRAGARVLLAARGEAALAAARSDLAAHGEVHAVATDVAHEESVEQLFESAERLLGGLDGVIHAAALLGPIGPALDAPSDEWWAAVRTNLFGTFLVATAAARRMRARGGRIVLFSGGGATSPFPNFSAYGSSKAAVVRLAETLAAELESEGIAVNCIAPGLVATRMQEQTLAAGERAGAEYGAAVRQRLADGDTVAPELAADAAVFLLSDRSDGITGRLLAAAWDGWREWPEHLAELQPSDVFTLRRIVPADRGFGWR